MITVMVAWGNENNTLLEEVDKDDYIEWFEDHRNNYGVEEYQFDTEAEVNAFIKGIEESNGWNEV